MYENHKLCPTLKDRELCFVVEQYVKGHFERLFHMHVSRFRLAHDTKLSLLRALVARFFDGQAMPPEWIVQGHLNSRGKEPSALGYFRTVASYPEPGVIRYYCGSNTTSWVDEVIRPFSFRPEVSASL